MAQVKRDSEIKIAETKTLASINRIEQGDMNAAKLDEVSISTRGWKDEYLLFLVTTPVIMAFIPEYKQYAIDGFQALTELPEWYMWILLGVYIDTFGFRRMLRVAMEQWVAKRFG
jgi:hypothetical protein